MQQDSYFDEALTALMARVNCDAENAETLEKLDGEVIALTAQGSDSRYAAIKQREMRLLDEAEPTIWIEGGEDVILKIVSGEMDPLIAMATRKLKVKTTPTKGPLLRKLFYGK